MSIASSQPQVRFSNHCVQRYVERLRPWTDPAAAKRDLACMHQTMTFTLPPPAWLEGCQRHDADAYLVLGDDIAFILRHSPTDSTSWCAVTVLVGECPATRPENDALPASAPAEPVDVTAVPAPVERARRLPARHETGRSRIPR